MNIEWQLVSTQVAFRMLFVSREQGSFRVRFAFIHTSAIFNVRQELRIMKNIYQINRINCLFSFHKAGILI